MNNTITVITPSFNQGQFIEETIYSVLSQEGNFFIDYIIADGGSTDNSEAIIKKYDQLLKAKKYSIKCRGIEYRWWSREDRGQTHAINQGLKIARGDILAWINSDDYYKQGAFDFVIKKFKENPGIDLIYGNCYEVYESGKIKIGEALPGNFKKNLQEGCLISQPAAFFTKKVLKSIGYLDESLHFCMDYDLWLRILKCGKAKYFKKNLAYFRVWSNSKTSSKQKGFRQEEKLIRQKYGGSRFNPGLIHRVRQKIPLTNFIKKKFPVVYFFCKNIAYKLVNIVK